MKRRLFLHSSAAFLGAGVLHPILGHADREHTLLGHTASVMAECATRFLAALDDNQRAKASFPFSTDERMNWHFIPNNIHLSFDSLAERKSLPLRNESRSKAPCQRSPRRRTEPNGLHQSGHHHELDEVLRAIGNDPGHRNPDNYYFSIFGTPSDTDAWADRIEGHHLSQNYTIVRGQVVDGPSFFGSNPAEVRKGPRKGLRTLPREDDLGLELIRSLDEQQRKVAIVDTTSYNEILADSLLKVPGRPARDEICRV